MKKEEEEAEEQGEGTMGAGGEEEEKEERRRNKWSEGGGGGGGGGRGRGGEGGCRNESLSMKGFFTLTRRLVSVSYNIVRRMKIFYKVPATDKNLIRFEEWQKVTVTNMEG